MDLFVGVLCCEIGHLQNGFLEGANSLTINRFITNVTLAGDTKDLACGVALHQAL